VIAAASESTARTAVRLLPRAPGVYRFRDLQGRVLYIGRAGDLRHRVGSYWISVGDRRRLLRMVSRIARLEAVVCASEHEAAWLERNLIERSMPSWNRTAGGQEVPVYVRVDCQSRSPSIDVIHAPQARPGVSHFGPYLGGLRVRAAVSGLRRAFPLALTGDRVAGSALDMARIRGVGTGDRATFIAMLAAVLQREQSAVSDAQARLAHLRDRAAAGLAFELAAEVQAELHALDWLVAEQRVSRPGPDDIDVCGWWAGTLVHFEVRGGRLNAWRQRRCDENAARTRLATTPPPWQDFARSNAELAAQLTAAQTR
jgi:excinuclease ABC subunit C